MTASQGALDLGDGKPRGRALSIRATRSDPSWTQREGCALNEPSQARAPWRNVHGALSRSALGISDDDERIRSPPQTSPISMSHIDR